MPSGAGLRLQRVTEMRQIDPKFHVDGDRIVKTSNGEAIPDDEPLMLFRARDNQALRMLHGYRLLCVLEGCTDFHLSGIDNRIAAFQAFVNDHPERMKQPGVTRGL